MELSSHCLLVRISSLVGFQINLHTLSHYFSNMHVHRMGNMEVVRYLVTEASCDPSVGNSEGWTPLHIACWYNNGT
jgi:ankyrin repeat protein